MDGQNSCYGGPSFQIFLRTDRMFVKSAAFTELAQSYCGMFHVDHQKKRLATMTKSGCCWHQFNTFVVVGRAPALIESIVEELLHGASSYLKRETSGQKVSSEYFLLPPSESGSQPLLAFDLAVGSASPCTLANATSS